jgi:hypothetical protein
MKSTSGNFPHTVPILLVRANMEHCFHNAH